MPLAEASSCPAPSSDRPGARQFAFVASAGPLVAGTVGGLAVLALLALWAWWSGRLQHVDVTFAAVVVTSALASVAWVTSTRWRTARRAAWGLGCVELDDEGLRWRRRDRSLGYDVRWEDVALATVDARNCTVLLRQLDGSPVLVGVLSEHGVPSGFVVLERFAELVELVDRKVPSAPHRGTRDPAAARGVLGRGLLLCGTAAALFVANQALGAQLHWHRLLLPMPVVVGAIGLLTLLAGARVRLGRGSLISPMYGPGHGAAVLRFLVVATVANFLLLGLVNGLAR